eukprot:TRINITY_DN13235_c0_g1_i1.p1 TRINITY_DN13235_c0_g1~~TRINITY_DN13235_c0_g1_i1.p1  ORF type:complete len:500 (-),score=152.00 TRINITY_DN13235_c0_g1_i1:233-1732(-)
MTAAPLEFTPAQRIQQDENKAIEEYCQKHDIEGLVKGLVHSLYREKPDAAPLEHFAHRLRMDLMRRKMGSEYSEGELADQAKAMEVPGRKLKELFEATKNIASEIVPRETIRVIINETIRLVNADRVSLFVYDKRIDMLVLNASNLTAPIRVKPGQGISGDVFLNQTLVNLADVYTDPRFDQGFDQKTGYRTKAIICVPIIDHEGECMGVLQAINKLDSNQAQPHFSRADEILMETLCQQCSIALRNAEVYRAAIVTSERANALLHMIQSLSKDLGVQSIVLTVTMHANELVQADRCTVFLIDEKKQQLWSISTDDGKEIRIPKNAGIAGECAETGKLIVIHDAYQDSRFNQAIDKKTGYRTQSIMAVPVMKRFGSHGKENACLAVIQMINKMEFDGEVGKFDDEDVQVMETFATFVATKLQNSHLLGGDSSSKPQSEASVAFGHLTPKGGTGSPRGSMDIGSLGEDKSKPRRSGLPGAGPSEAIITEEPLQEAIEDEG